MDQLTLPPSSVQAGTRRDREEASPIPAPPPQKTEMTGFIRVGHWFAKDKNGIPYGKCLATHCNVHANQDPMPRNCVANSRWKLEEGEIIEYKKVVHKPLPVVVKIENKTENKE